jgi:hypothetical protein
LSIVELLGGERMTQVRQFKPWGPYPVPIIRRDHQKEIARREVATFWSDVAGDALGDSKGCYIFALANGNSYQPIYVGKTSRSFRSECFEAHKREKVRDGMWDEAARRGRRGHLVLFLFEYPGSKGKLNRRVIDELETFLIGRS